jgi:diphthamide biosynthesis protein 3
MSTTAIEAQPAELSAPSNLATATSANSITSEANGSSSNINTSSTDASSTVKKIVLDSSGKEVINDPDTGYYDEIEIEDMDYDEDQRIYFYPCPCGDKFKITVDELMDGEEIAKCPSCSLVIKVIYDPEQFFEEDDS